MEGAASRLNLTLQWSTFSIHCNDQVLVYVYVWFMYHLYLWWLDHVDVFTTELTHQNDQVVVGCISPNTANVRQSFVDSVRAEPPRLFISCVV